MPATERSILFLTCRRKIRNVFYLRVPHSDRPRDATAVMLFVGSVETVDDQLDIADAQHAARQFIGQGHLEAERLWGVARHRIELPLRVLVRAIALAGCRIVLRCGVQHRVRGHLAAQGEIGLALAAAGIADRLAGSRRKPADDAQGAYERNEPGTLSEGELFQA